MEQETDKKEDDLEMTKDEIHEALTATSVKLHYDMWDIPREIQVRRPSPNEWSPLEILIHLRQVGEVYAERVKRVVQQDKEGDDIPYLHDFDEDKQMDKINLDEETAKYNLGIFMEARSKLLNQVSFIEDEEWDELKCEHEERGVVSLRELLIPLVKREKKYVEKIKKVLNT